MPDDTITYAPTVAPIADPYPATTPSPLLPKSVEGVVIITTEGLKELLRQVLREEFPPEVPAAPKNLVTVDEKNTSIMSWTFSRVLEMLDALAHKG